MRHVFESVAVLLMHCSVNWLSVSKFMNKFSMSSMDKPELSIVSLQRSGIWSNFDGNKAFLYLDHKSIETRNDQSIFTIEIIIFRNI